MLYLCSECVRGTNKVCTPFMMGGIMHHDCKYLNFLTRDYYCVSDRRVALCGICEDDVTTTPTG